MPWGLRHCGAAETQGVGRWEAGGHKAGEVVGARSEGSWMPV